MKITIVGAGNVGTQFAVHCAEKGHHVTIYSPHFMNIGKELYIVDKDGQKIHSASIEKATNDSDEAFKDADVIFLVIPAFMFKRYAQMIGRYAKPEMKIGIIPGTGGGECAFQEAIARGAVVFGVQRVPSVARLVEYGKTVRAVGYRKEMYVAAIPERYTIECCSLVESILDIKTFALPNYLNITLTPSNAILHTARLRVLFSEYQEGMVYTHNPLFYEEWDDVTSELLMNCDDEVQKICRSLKKFDLSFVKSLKVHYECNTKEQMTKKISSIEGFKGLLSPVIPVKGGYIPDFNSRYFTADFPYGLAILVQIADFTGVQVLHMRATLNWYYDMVENRQGYRYSDYNIFSADDFINFYSI